MTPMPTYEYMRLPLALIPTEVIAQYNLNDITNDNYVYMEIRKSMPGLKQAGIIAYARLKDHLLKHGYKPVPRTPSLWKHETRPITFCLVVDDFGVSYCGKENDEHLLQTLQILYTVTLDWTGSLYCGLTIKWDYSNKLFYLHS